MDTRDKNVVIGVLIVATSGGLIGGLGGSGLGEHFSDDWDKDGIEDEFDNCPHTSNPNQEDKDRDRVGDACDSCPDKPAPGFSDGCPAE